MGFSDDYSIESVVDLLQNHIEGLFAALPAKGGKDLLGLVVVGYSSGSLLSEEWKLAFRNGRIETHECLFGPEEAGLWWAGRTEALDRLVSGVDERLLSLLPATCRLTQEQTDTVKKVCEEELAAPLIDPAMPIQDVIDLARFLVDVTCCYERFTPGPALVSGPVEIAAVTRYEGFKWVARKHWFSKELNRDDKAR